MNPGTLYVVSTPIGNLGDITFRAAEILKSVDAVACEDTRRTQKLLSHLGLKKPLIRYDERVHARATPQLLTLLGDGQSIALVSDAGSPSISDPGSRLVRAALDEGFPVLPIPGPSSVTAALSVAGMKGSEFYFLGFLPRKPGPAKRLLREAWDQGKIIVLFESPFRVAKTLEWIEEIAPLAELLVAREMTKMHEEYARGPAQSIRAQFQDRTPKGEFVILIGPRNEKKR